MHFCVTYITRFLNIIVYKALLAPHELAIARGYIHIHIHINERFAFLLSVALMFYRSFRLRVSLKMPSREKL